MDIGVHVVNNWIIEYELQIPAYVQARLIDKINEALAGKKNQQATEWKVFTDYNYEWEDCTVGIYCPICKRLIVLDSQNGTEGSECCGKEYYLSATVYTREKPIAKE